MPVPLPHLQADGTVSQTPEILLQDLHEGPVCSIVIPCFNYGAFVEEAVQSALAQTMRAVEVILVDDGSTDPHTRKVVTSLAGRPGLKVLLTENRGPSAARNLGICAARGAYVCCLDADDVLPPSYVEQCVYVLESHRNVGFVCGWVQHFGRTTKTWKTQDFSIDMAMNRNMTAQGSVYRKSDWGLAGGYDERIIMGFEDWEFWLRMGQLGRAGRVICTRLNLRRQHGESRFQRSQRHRDVHVAQIRALNRRLYEDPDWVATVRAHALRNDPFTYPASLARLRAALTETGRPEILCITGLHAGAAAMRLGDLMGRLKPHYSVTVVTIRRDEDVGEPACGMHLDDSFQLPEAGMPGGSAAFIGYLIETRKVCAVLLAGERTPPELVLEIRARHPQLPVLDIVKNGESANHAAITEALRHG